MVIFNPKSVNGRFNTLFYIQMCYLVLLKLSCCTLFKKKELTLIYVLKETNIQLM